MHPRLLMATIVGCCLFNFSRPVFAAPPNDACNLPQDLQSEISRTYPGWKVVNLSDLEEDDKGLFQKDHGTECPGLVKVDFYGDGKPALALVLTMGDGAKRKTELVVAHKLGEQWQTTRLNTVGGANPPVVWRQNPGTYKDIESGKIIRATRPVIVFCGYESWAILYAWTGKGVDKVWLEE
jgi:hypothetical protein